MEQRLKNELVEAFRRHLDEDGDEDGEGGQEAGTVDLFTLFSELAALKNEVRIESRQVKGALDAFHALFATVQEAHGVLTREADGKRREGEALRPLLLELLELRDRMAAGLAAVTQTPPGWGERLMASGLRDALAEGQRMSLERLDALLAGRGVQPLHCLGKPLDPQCMRAVETVRDARVAGGVVVTEVRKGFMWEQRLLRPAEVVVNKGSDSETP